MKVTPFPWLCSPALGGRPGDPRGLRAVGAEPWRPSPSGALGSVQPGLDVHACVCVCVCVYAHVREKGLGVFGPAHSPECVNRPPRAYVCTHEDTCMSPADTALCVGVVLCLFSGPCVACE